MGQGPCGSASHRPGLCHVATLGSGLEGWTAAEVLAETAAVASADAFVPGPLSHATCEVNCTPAANTGETIFAFGIIRQGSGSVQSTLPDGTIRVLEFQTGIPMAMSPATGGVAPPMMVTALTTAAS